MCEFWEKADKKKLKKWSIIVISGISAVIIVICIANACIPALSQEEVKKLVIAELNPQTEEVKSELNISDVTIDLDIFDYEYEKPTVFSRGYIRFEVDDYYVSNEFSELDDEIYTAETCSKYRKKIFVLGYRFQRQKRR